MSLKKYIALYIQLDHLIEMESTGSPKELAKKLGVSERQVFNYISDLKELGKPVVFSAIRNSYYYDNKLESV